MPRSKSWPNIRKIYQSLSIRQVKSEPGSTTDVKFVPLSFRSLSKRRRNKPQPDQDIHQPISYDPDLQKAVERALKLDQALQGERDFRQQMVHFRHKQSELDQQIQKTQKQDAELYRETLKDYVKWQQRKFSQASSSDTPQTSVSPNAADAACHVGYNPSLSDNISQLVFPDDTFFHARPVFLPETIIESAGELAI
ncbi:hypothetical protein MMC20_001463 [Loxospora ochrophaea]|nr:hypothetical protein [Loxospora ochrophaea]